MRTGRYIGIMSGTSLDGIDVVLAAIDEHTVAQQARYCHPIPLPIKQADPGDVPGPGGNPFAVRTIGHPAWHFVRRGGAKFIAADRRGAARGDGYRLSRPNRLA